MEFRLLGPLEVLRAGCALAVRGAKQRALLVLLLFRANEVVSRDELIEGLWGADPPDDPAHSLDVQVSRLRKTLEPDEPLVTRASGYVLEVAWEDVDGWRFEQLLEEGRNANAAGDAAGAAETLRRALALWRGRALADVAYEPFARVEIERLEDLRLAAIEERIDADLALGRHQAIVPELESLTAKHPLRERLRGQLMLALYRSGRQAESLRVYANTRRAFSVDLGLEPGQELRELEQAILRQDPSLGAAAGEPARRRRRGRIAAAILVPVAAVAGAAGVLLAHGGTQSSQAESSSQRNSVSLVSERTGNVVGQANAEVPVFDRFSAGALWNVSFAGVLKKIDPGNATTTGFVNAVPVPCGLDVGAGSVWVTDCTSPTVARFDPDHVVLLGRYPLPVSRSQPQHATETGGVAVGAGSVWVGQGSDNPSYVYRLNPRTGKVQRRIVIPEGGATAIAFGNGAVWVGGGDIGRVSRIDPRSYAVTRPARDFGPGLCCVAAGGGYVWTGVGHTLWKISQEGRVLSGTKMPATMADLRYADRAVWASAGDAGVVVRVDPTTDVPRTYRIGHVVFGVDARDGVLAVSVQSSTRDVTSGLKGRIAYVALKSDMLDSQTSTDPVGVQSFNAEQAQFHYATCAKLFNYPDAAGAAGKRLEPEVAAGWPTVKDGGRTYTFTIRPGFGFSPPSHERVTAESFRHEIERFLKQPGSGSLQTLADVVGADAYAAGRTAHVSGITAHGDRLVIRLSKSAGDLPIRLARPAFCAVPADLAIVPYGLQSPIPTAGPYYLADRSRDVFLLRPNPNYHGPRPQKLDGIVYRTGVDVGKAAEQVALDEVDYVQEQDPALSPDTAAARSAGARYRLTANNWTERLALNTRRPVFADVRVRRAVALALDRAALARRLEQGAFELPTSRLLPPNLLRSPGDPRNGTNADLRSARRLMGGRRLHVVLAAYAPATGGVYEPGVIEALGRELGAIGITVDVAPLRQGSTPAQSAAVLTRADMARTNGDPGAARDSVDYLLHLPYLPPADRAQLDRIASFLPPRRETAAAEVAARLERDAVYFAYADSATPELLSKRLGCVIDQPEYPGLDLAALCLQDS